MAEGENPADARPAARESGLDPIGQALRATYDADNHDSLGRDLTGLMLALARVDDEPGPAVPALAPPPPSPSPSSWFRTLLGRVRR